MPSTKSKIDDIFYIDEGEQVIDEYTCALSDKILLQGKLYITNKKLVFYSWFNNSTLFGKTLMEIPLTDITAIEKRYNLIFDNSIAITTRGNAEMFLTSFINRDKCFRHIHTMLVEKGIIKCESPLSKTNSENTSVNQDNVAQENLQLYDGIPIEERNSVNNGVTNANSNINHRR